MNVSKKYKFIYWSTPACASRAVCAFLQGIGSDMWNFDMDFNVKARNKTCTHTVGIPKEYKNYPIIAAARNPYSRIVAAYNDVSFEDPDMTFDQFISEIRGDDGCYTSRWMEHQLPSYVIRLEHMEEDLNRLDFIKDKVSNELWEESLNESIRHNSYRGERPKDSYDEKGLQITKTKYTQEQADKVYEIYKNSFKVVGYKRDSWK